MSDQPTAQPPKAPELSGPQAETGITAGGGTTALPSTPRPYGGYFDDVADALAIAYPDLSQAVERSVVDRGELTLHVRRDTLPALAQQLRDAGIATPTPATPR